MKDKIQEATNHFIAEQHYVNPMLQDACMEGIEFGINYQQQIIDQLLKDKDELLSALKKADEFISELDYTTQGLKVLSEIRKITKK